MSDSSADTNVSLDHRSSGSVNWHRRRYQVLISLLVLEIAFLITLYTAGWNGTTMILAGLAAGAPLLVGFLFVFYRGRRFSIRSLLIATACFGTFIAITVQPLLKARQARQATLALEKIGLRRHFHDDLYNFLKFQGRTRDALAVVDPVNSTPEIPSWLQPVAGNLLKTPRDDSQFVISTINDAQLNLVCDWAERFPNLRMLYIHEASRQSLSYFADQFDQFPLLDIVHLSNTTIPDGVLGKLKTCRTLSLAIRANNSYMAGPTGSQLAEIAALPNLEILYITLPLSDSDLMRLAPSRSLVKIHVRGSILTRRGIEAFHESNPNCRVAFTP